MDFRNIPVSSPSSSTSSTSDRNPSTHHQNGNTTSTTDPMHTWWESISKARSRIHLLSTLLPATENSDSPSSSTFIISSLADSDRPATSLLQSSAAYSSLTASLTTSPVSGSGDDPLCHWLYDTFLSSDPDLRLVVLSYLPLISHLYLTRLHSVTSAAPTPSLSGFEAVLLALYSSETKARNGKPVLINIPDLSQPSLYHSPRTQQNPTAKSSSTKAQKQQQSRPIVGVLSPPLEPQIAIKSTKRATIVGVGLDCYYKQIAHMPAFSKLDFCRFVADWAGQDCVCKSDFDDEENDKRLDDFSEDGNGFLEDAEIVEERLRNLEIESAERIERLKGVRIPLPWEMLQPVLRILGHCLLGPLCEKEVKDAASVAVRCLYARASHDLVPQAILATRSLIQLDKKAREDDRAAAEANASSNANTPSKAKKPEILLVSK